nr:MAG TPA: hypothetical protein [Caudoviricetes sp.]
MEKVDKTIENICDWIDEQIVDVNCFQESSILPEMISALAEIIKARAEMLHE